MNKLMIFIASIVILFLFCCGNEEIPKDDNLISVYKNNRGIFEQIRSEMCRSRYYYIRENGTSDPEDIPKKELDKYYDLLERIGVKSVSKSTKCNVSFEVWSEGFVGTNKTKGFILNPSLEGLVVDNLDNKDLIRKKTAFYYKHIEGGWYLYFYYWV